MYKFRKFFYGLIPGLIIPIVFAWIYISRFFPTNDTFIDVIIYLHHCGMLGRTILLSVMPNLCLVYLFYKQDNFDIAKGIIIGAMPYLIYSIFIS